MKNQHSKRQALLFTVLATAGLTMAAPPPAPQADQRGTMHDATTEQALQKQIQTTASFDSQIKASVKPALEGRPDVKSSLMTSSIFLFDGAHYTIIPVGSILSLPKQHRNHVIPEPQGDFTFWPNFLKLNSSWVAAKEVPLAMAKGDGKAGEAVMRSLIGSDRVLVSVYKGGPISILEPTPDSTGTGDKSVNSAKP
jgi:hypothetical protein